MQPNEKIREAVDVLQGVIGELTDRMIGRGYTYAGVFIDLDNTYKSGPIFMGLTFRGSEQSDLNKRFWLADGDALAAAIENACDYIASVPFCVTWTSALVGQTLGIDPSEEKANGESQRAAAVE